jgi:hypothetical protein
MNAPVDTPVLVAGMSPLEIASLLGRAYKLRAGDLTLGTQINADVSVAYEREQHAAGSIYIATHRIVVHRSMSELAAAMGIPVWVPNTLDAYEIQRAQAVLRHALLNLTYAEWLYRGRVQGTPVNEATIGAAVKLVTDAEKAALERDVQQAEGKF